MTEVSPMARFKTELQVREMKRDEVEPTEAAASPCGRDETAGSLTRLYLTPIPRRIRMRAHPTPIRVLIHTTQLEL